MSKNDLIADGRWIELEVPDENEEDRFHPVRSRKNEREKADQRRVEEGKRGKEKDSLSERESVAEAHPAESEIKKIVSR